MENVCEHCGQVETNELTRVRVDWTRYEEWCEWCEECVERDATQVKMGYGEHELWSVELASDYAYTCPKCGELVDCDFMHEIYVENSDGYYRNTEMWCEECIDDHTESCEDCEESFEEGLLTTIHLYDGEDRLVCNHCIQNDYLICDDCGNWVHTDDAYISDYDGNAYCPDCWDGNHQNTDSIREYGHTSGVAFWIRHDLCKEPYELNADEKKLPYLGIELEVDDFPNWESRNECANALVYGICGYDEDQIVLKEDGSLHQGFEIVSQPMTPEVHLNMGMWEDITSRVKDYGGTSHDAGTCGLHIHINRDSFEDGDDSVYRLDRIIHRFQYQMQKFARRSDYQMHWCAIGEDKLADIEDIDEKKSMWKKGKRYRYEAVNTTNPATVELRLFRGTLNMETIHATIQFAYGLLLIANAMSDEFADQITWSAIKTCILFSLEEKGIGHHELDAYFNRRGL